MTINLIHPENIMNAEHVPIMTQKDFILMQAGEIERFSMLTKTSNRNEAVIEWITRFSKSYREFWRPFIFPSEDIVNLVRNEIARHRWIESEKIGVDLGVEAELDWIRKHSSAFKKHWKIKN